MIICKKLDRNIPITNLGQWEKIVRKEHWKDRKSAKELAKIWMETKGEYLEGLIGSKDEFEGIKFKLASPEYESKFDDYGSGRNHDLLVLAEDKKGEVLISLEAKVEEGFDERIEDKYYTYLFKRINGEPTYLPDRIEGLLASVFKRKMDKEVFNLRYQLLHAVAGTVAEAKKRNINKAILLVNTFWARDVEYSNAYKRNTDDLNQFLKYLSVGDINSIENNLLIGPFNTKTTEHLSGEIDLYIMKVESIMK